MVPTSETILIMSPTKHSKAAKGPVLPERLERRVFSAAEANAALPLVRAIVADLVPLARDVTERRQRLLSIARSGSRNGTDPYEEELVQMEEE